MKTIKELSEQLQVTPQSIRNEVERQSISKTKNKGGRGFCVTDEDAERIITAFSERRSDAKQSKATQKNKQNDDLLLLLQSEIETKNRQIEYLQKENAALTAALEKTTESLQIAQRLHAGTMQGQIEEKAAETSTEPESSTAAADPQPETKRTQQTEPEKKSFWQRLFGK